MGKNDFINYEKINLLGMDIHALHMNEVLCICEEQISKRGSLLLGVVNVAKIVKCRNNRELRKSLEQSDIVLADGLPIVWLSKIIGKPLPERVAGIDIMSQLLKRSSEKNYRVYFLGAAQQVIEKVIETVRKEYPGIQIAGYRDGYFEESEAEEVADEIKNSSADILFVAISSPKKENFLRRWRHHMNVPICHGVGGSFDVVAGITKRAPAWMQRCGLEWFYRLGQEPWRMWKRYLVTNTIFVVIAINAILKAAFLRLCSPFVNTVDPLDINDKKRGSL